MYFKQQKCTGWHRGTNTVPCWLKASNSPERNPGINLSSVASICILQNKHGRTNPSRNHRLQLFTRWVLRHKSNRRAQFGFKTYSQAKALNYGVRLTWTEVFTNLSMRILYTEQLPPAEGYPWELWALHRALPVSRGDPSLAVSHISVNLGPMTHDSCFPERSNQYYEETWSVFFLPL